MDSLDLDVDRMLITDHSAYDKILEIDSLAFSDCENT